MQIQKGQLENTECGNGNGKENRGGNGREALNGNQNLGLGSTLQAWLLDCTLKQLGPRDSGYTRLTARLHYILEWF